MARKIRIEYAGAAYHVMARGNQGQDIYADDRDRKLWLETLGQACEKTGWRIHAWVMMNNHYHLLLETPEANLVAGMKWLQGTYTQRYNSRHEIFGHLFQGRYKAVLVEPEGGDYFAVVSTYIHLNPARAGWIRVGKEGLGGYRWSSYPWYVRAGEARPKWFVTEHVLGNLGLPPKGRKGYKAYIEWRVLELGLKRGRKELAEEWKAIRRGWCVGGTDFKERMLAWVEQPLRQGRRGSYSGEAKRAHGEAEAERLLACGLAALGMTEGQLAETRKGAWEKEVLAGWLCQHTTARRRWVSERLGMGDESRVTQAIGRLKRKGQPKLERLKRRLEQVYENHNREA
jgi:REP element-mobilizing transposase RayT